MCLAWFAAWPWQGISKAVFAAAALCPAAARLDDVAQAWLFPALFRHLPKDSRGWICICFSSFLVWSKPTGDISPLKEQQCLVWERMRSRKDRKRLSHCVFGCSTAFLHLHQASTAENWGSAALPAQRWRREGSILSPQPCPGIFLSLCYHLQS